jgi:DNA recombination protein RmuC
MDATPITILSFFLGAAAASIVLLLFVLRLRSRHEQRLDSESGKREAAEHELARLREQLTSRQEQLAEQKRLLEEAETKFKDVFKSLATQVLETSSEQLRIQAKGESDQRQKAFESTLQPFKELLEKQQEAVQSLDKRQEADKRGLEVQIKNLLDTSHQLRQETHRLTSALRRPERRGRWGEFSLRNVVEIAGMAAHVDFYEQPQTEDPRTRDRPDMTVRMPGGGVIVVDSKVALDAYLDSLDPEINTQDALGRHAAQVRKHVDQLSTKAYWNQFEHTPDLVVMYVPVDSALTAALDVQPEIQERAMKSHVMIATPMLLLAFLQAVAYGWRQEDVAQNARDISDAGAELYDRLSKFVEHFKDIGTSLSRASRSYGDAVGSLESMLLPGARRLKELNATQARDIEAPGRPEVEVRQIVREELLPSPQSEVEPRADGESNAGDKNDT